MRLFKPVIAGALAAAGLCVLSGGASAADLKRFYMDNPAVAIAEGVVVPPGYTTYYISGALPKPIKPAEPGKPADYGDITQQTRSVLDNLKATMAKMGVGFGDVVAAHVFLDPKADFMAMNKVWATEFGTKTQPNKPARAAMHVNALVAPGALLEIEFIAVKKP